MVCRPDMRLEDYNICCFHMGSPWSEAEMRQRRRMAEPLFVVFLRGINILGVWLKVFHPGCLFDTKGFPYGRFQVTLCEHIICTPDIGPCSPEG